MGYNEVEGPTEVDLLYLYVILFSRQVVGWMVADCESASLAKKLIRESCLKQRIDRDQLILHADNDGRKGQFSEIDYTFSYARSYANVSVDVGTIFYRR